MIWGAGRPRRRYRPGYRASALLTYVCGALVLCTCVGPTIAVQRRLLAAPDTGAVDGGCYRPLYRPSDQISRILRSDTASTPDASRCCDGKCQIIRCLCGRVFTCRFPYRWREGGSVEGIAWEECVRVAWQRWRITECLRRESTALRSKRTDSRTGHGPCI